MKKSILAALALVVLASCAKENGAIEPVGEKVAATFTSAAITRVAGNAWVEGDKIGITMLKKDLYDLADGYYENFSHTVSAAGASGTFTPTPTGDVTPDPIYFPVDGSAVDFVAYYPYSEIDDDKNISVSVAEQEDEHIDLIAAKAKAKTKANPTVQFANNTQTQTYEAFAHQLSKLTLTIVPGEGLSSLAGLATTIKGQYTTAEWNIYSAVYSDRGNVANITAITTADGTKAEAILIPTGAIEGSQIVFTLDGNDYIWDISAISFDQGKEYKYTVTINKKAVTISSPTIDSWGDGNSNEDENLDALLPEPDEIVANINDLNTIMEKDDEKSKKEAWYVVNGEITGENNTITIPDLDRSDATRSITLKGGIADGNTLKITTNDTNNSATDPRVVDITVTEASQGSLDIDLPNSTVYINGTCYGLNAATYENTLIIQVDAVVTDLTITKGNVEIYGKVNTLSQSDSNEEITMVTIYTNGGGETKAKEMLENYDALISNAEFVINVVDNTNIKNATTGKYYGSLKLAVAAAKPNDVISLAAGEYTSGATIDKPQPYKDQTQVLQVIAAIVPMRQCSALMKRILY